MSAHPAQAKPQSGGRQRIGIVGSGAIGGHFAARLALAGHTVSMLARGRTLDKLRQHGLRYQSGDGMHCVPVLAGASADELGAQDLLLLTVKGQALPEVAAALGPMLTADSTVLTLGNGLPWWYFLVPGVPLSGLRLRSADPLGTIERALGLDRLLGGTVFASCHCPEPGFVVHASGGRVVVGEPGGGDSARAERWATLLADAGLGGSATSQIRRELWLKLLGNVCFNPMSLLTQTSTDRMLADPGLERLAQRLMRECISLGDALGLDLQVAPDQRIAQTRKLGAIKTSMLQDLEAEREVELDAILGTVLECAQAAACDVPQLDSLYALAAARSRQAGLYRPA